MILLLARTLILTICTASSFAVLGRAPGAVNLRLREVETEIAGPSKASRDNRFRAVIVGPDGSPV